MTLENNTPVWFADLRQSGYTVSQIVNTIAKYLPVTKNELTDLVGHPQLNKLERVSIEVILREDKADAEFFTSMADVSISIGLDSLREGLRSAITLGNFQHVIPFIIGDSDYNPALIVSQALGVELDKVKNIPAVTLKILSDSISELMMFDKYGDPVVNHFLHTPTNTYRLDWEAGKVSKDEFLNSNWYENLTLKMALKVVKQKALLPGSEWEDPKDLDRIAKDLNNAAAFPVLESLEALSKIGSQVE